MNTQIKQVSLYFAVFFCASAPVACGDSTRGEDDDETDTGNGNVDTGADTDTDGDTDTDVDTDADTDTDTGPGCVQLFNDDFETGTLANWDVSDTDYTVDISSTHAANGTLQSMHMAGGGATHDGGIFHLFGSISPSYVSFWLRAASADLSGGYFMLQQGTNNVIYTYLFYDGTIKTIGPTLVNSFEGDRWYFFEITNINWVAHQFDLSLDGVELLTNHPFSPAGASATAIDNLYLYNYDVGEVWFDEIFICE